MGLFSFSNIKISSQSLIPTAWKKKKKKKKGWGAWSSGSKKKKQSNAKVPTLPIGNPSFNLGLPLVGAATPQLLSAPPLPPLPPPAPWKVSKDKVTPVSAKGSLKSSSIVAADQISDSSVETITANNSDENAPKTSQEIAISNVCAEPIAVFNLKTSDFQGPSISPLMASVKQAHLEDRISQEFLSAIFEKMLVGNEKELKQLDANLSQQIKNSQNSIDQLRAIFNLLQTANKSMTPSTGRNSISAITQQKIAALCKVDPLSELNDQIDPMTLIDRFCTAETTKNLNGKSQTALLTQVLQFASNILSNGYSPALMGDALLNVPPGQFSVRDSLVFAEREKYRANLKLFSMQTQPDGSYVYLHGETPYMTHDFYKNLILPANRRSLALVTMLSNEYALSAGIARLSDTTLGNRFGANSNDPILTFLGVKGQQDASLETGQPGSLVDYFVVGDDGANRTQEKNRILLFDGTGVKETQTVHNSFATFMKSTVRSPLKNRMNLFDDAIVRSNTSFEEGLKFYDKLHLRDQKLDLLTPRGLYTRLLSELSESLTQLAASKGSGKDLNIVEMGVFRELSRNKSNNSATKSSVLKRYLLAMMVNKAIMKLNDKNFDQTTPDKDAAKASQKSTTSTVSTKDLTTKKVTTSEITVTTPQNTASGGTDIPISFPNDVIRFSPTDSYLLDRKLTNFTTNLVKDSLLTMSSDYAPKLRVNEVNIVMQATSFFEQNYKEETSLINRIVRIFLDLHDEAKKASKAEDGNALWLTPTRVTRNSQLDGTLSMSMLLEAMIDLVSMFVDAQVRKTAYPLAFSVLAPVGQESRHETSLKAIKLLVQGSKGNNFDTLVNSDGLLPDLENRSPDIVVTSLTSTSAQSFRSMTQYFVDLARERDLPLVSLASASAMISYQYQQSRNLSDLASMLRSEKEPTDLAKSLRLFAQTKVGKNYLSSVTDYSLDISQERLSSFEQSLARPSKRMTRIGAGEVACLEKILSEVGSIPTDNIIFCALGLPGDFVSDNLLDTFDLAAAGQQTEVDEKIATVTVEQDGVFDDVKYEPISRDFLVTRPFDRNSFNDFTINPPSSIDDIVGRVMLTSGMTGAQFVGRFKEEARVKAIVIDEIRSYLLKKALSILSTVDMSEENLIQVDYENRSSSAQNLAKKVSAMADLPDGTFDNVFFVKDGVTKLSENELRKLTGNNVKKTASGQTFDAATIDLGTAELFYDIFDSAYFYDGLVTEKVFAPSYFDKILGVVFSSDEFKSLSDENKEKVKGSKKVNTNNQLDAGLIAADTTQGTISIMSYAAQVSKGVSVMVK